MESRSPEHTLYLPSWRLEKRVCVLGRGSPFPRPSPPRGHGVAEPGAELASPRGRAAGRRPQPGAGRRTGTEPGPAGSPAVGRPSALRCGGADRDPELSTLAERVSERRVSAAQSCFHFQFFLVLA
ncbi:hypothetical protein ACRRTK_016813 [Alexandromys fortis]